MIKNSIIDHHSFDRSSCPVANVLDLFGDKWTLLVVRDLILGKSRYNEFAESSERIPTNILADRLKRIEQFGIVLKSPYCLKPTRYQYELTEKGKDLIPILEAMVFWATKYMPDTQVFPSYIRKT